MNNNWYEIMARKVGRIKLDREACKACYLCISVCPENLIEASEKLNQKGYYAAEFIERNNDEAGRRCTGCATCAIMCPDVAIEVYRE